MKRRTSTTLTKEEALEQFLAEKQSIGLVDLSIKGYRYEIGLLLEKVESLEDFSSKFFVDMINKMLETVKPTTVNHCIRTYRSFLYWCMEHEYIQPFKIRTIKYQEEPVRVYSLEDIEKLTVKPTHKDSFFTWRNWAIASFLLGTGARAGTLVNIKLEDIDLNRKEVIYRHTKNKKSSIIPLCDNLVKALRQYLNEFEINDYLFSDYSGNQMTVRALGKALQSFCSNRDVEFKSTHSFRHTYAREFIVNGGNPFQLQRMLDHQSLAMSQHYAHLFATDLHDAVNDFSPLSKIETSNERIKRK